MLNLQKLMVTSCLLFLGIGCTERGERAQVWTGTLGDDSISVRMHEKSKVDSGPNIQQLISAGMQAARGDFTEAIATAFDDSNDRFDSQLKQMAQGHQEQVGSLQESVSTTQVAGGSGLVMMLLPLVLQMIRAKKKDRELEEANNERVALAKQLPPEPVNV